VQFMNPAILSEALHTWGFPLEHCAAITATNAARIFDLYPRKGAIQIGADADLVLYDFERETTLNNDDLLTRHKRSALDGRAVRATVLRTIVRGQTVYVDGQITVEPGFGAFVTRVG